MKKIKQIIEFIQDLKYKSWSPLFAWYDLWIGLFWDKKKYWLYVLPLPMVGIIIKFESPAERDKRIYRDYLYKVTGEEDENHVFEQFYNLANGKEKNRSHAGSNS
jgi:hypothetical protein